MENKKKHPPSSPSVVGIFLTLLYMVNPTNKTLWEKAKAQAEKEYRTPSAYRSGRIVQLYKQMGGKFEGKKPKTGLTQWFSEKWTDIGRKGYPVYRPTVRVSASTPLTVNEIDPKNLKAQIEKKQRIKSGKLPPFIAKK